MKRPLLRFSLQHFAAVSAASVVAQPAATDRVQLNTFAIDRTEVTIAQFARFAQATSTVTRAETEGGGFEFDGGWQRRPGWTWRKPDGVAPASPQLPAVHLTHPGSAAAPTPGPPATARGAPTPATPTAGPAPRPLAPPRPASMACMTWAPMPDWRSKNHCCTCCSWVPCRV